MRSERRTIALFNQLVDMRAVCLAISHGEFDSPEGWWWFRVIVKFDRAIDLIQSDCDFVATPEHFRTMHKLHVRLDKLFRQAL